MADAILDANKIQKAEIQPLKISNYASKYEDKEEHLVHDAKLRAYF